MARRLPDFVGIGAQKSGTGWLYAQLRTHPQLFVSDPKELRYFAPRPGSVDRYAAHFAAARPDQLAGEITPLYLAVPEVPERMRAVLPGAKLLCLLRHPAERAFSQYKMARRLGNIPEHKSFAEAFDEDLGLLRRRGHYAEQLERFARHYPFGESLLVLPYERIVEAPDSVVRAVFEHLGVDVSWRPPRLGERFGRARTPELLSGADRARCLDYYAPHVRALELQLGWSLDSWRA